jgi:hypothetical protein
MQSLLEALPPPPQPQLQHPEMYQYMCFTQNTYRIVEWISRRHHTYPKTRKGWYNQIATQFCYYREHGTFHVPYDPQYMIDWLMSHGILRAEYGRKLRLSYSLSCWTLA